MFALRQALPIVMIAGVSIASTALAGFRHDSATTADAAYRTYGSTFTNVAWLATVNFETDHTQFSGSAVLVDPHWVLTAAHVVLPTDTIHDVFFDDYLVGFTNDFFADPGEYNTPSDIFIHPDFQDVGDGPDLALLYFDEPFSATPATIFSGPQLVGSRYDVTGFGVTGTPSVGLQLVPNGKRRAGTNRLTGIDALNGILQATFASPGSSGFEGLGMLLEPGDSGGGWFRNIDGQRYLAAITTKQDGLSSYGSASTATILTPEVTSWIDLTIESNSVPEIHSLALVSAVAAVAAFRIVSTWRTSLPG